MTLSCHFIHGNKWIQGVIFKKAISKEAWNASKKLTQESAVEITGEVRADARAPSGYELSVTDLNVVHYAEDGYPIQLKEHGVGFLMQYRHLWLRTPRQTAILRIRATIIKAIRDWLDDPADRERILVTNPARLYDFPKE